MGFFVIFVSFVVFVPPPWRVSALTGNCLLRTAYCLPPPFDSDR